jgi:hypothetical protein
VVAYCEGSAGIPWEFALMTHDDTISMDPKEWAAWGYGQPAGTLREGEEIAEKIAACTDCRSCG